MTPCLSIAISPDTSSLPAIAVFKSTDCSLISAINGYLWNFGDGVTSGQQNPSHTYQSAGSYQVSLELIYSCYRDTSIQMINLATSLPLISTILTQP